MSDLQTLERISALEKRIQELRGIDVPGNFTPGAILFGGANGQIDDDSTLLQSVGSFVPTLVGSTTPGTYTYVANANLVEYSRIGNRLHFNGRVAISAIAVAPVGTMTINGWPLAGVADANMAIAGGATMILWQSNLATAHSQIEGQFGNGTSVMTLIKSGDNLAGTAVVGSDIAIVGSLVEFRFFGSYRVA